MSDDIGFILSQRTETHGNFGIVAGCYTGMLSEVNRCMDYKREKASPAQIHALHAILMKIARIACGDHDHIDHWRDIEGYARLAREYIEKNEKYLKG